MQRVTGVRADARANRARLVAAAQEVFRERGLDAEMKEIADRAGVGIGTIYRNFPTKTDLVTAIIEDMLDHFRAVVAEAMAIDDPPAAVRALLRGGFAGLERFGDMAVTLQGSMPPECRARFAAFDVLAPLIELVARGLASGRFRAGIDVEVAAARIAASFHPAFFHRLRAGRTSDELAEAHADLILDGLIPRP